MTQNSHLLSQLDNHLFLTDGGLETTLTFCEPVELNDIGAYELLGNESGIALLRRYFIRYIDIAKRHGAGFILETPTWRGSLGWAARQGHSAADLARLVHRAVELMRELRDEHASADTPMLINGCIGPAGDGYNAAGAMTAEEAQRYHTAQVRTFSEASVDLVTAATINYSEEAIGIVRAANEAGVPVAISFTVETDGRLPTGQHLRDAIRQIDEATDTPPAYYMINCAHPTHFEQELTSGEPWTLRMRGLRANASCKSHAELDECTELDDGNPAEFGREHARLRERAPHISILGGCCGTDQRHVEAIARECCTAPAPV
ncbi:MAG: homocysteine S-methyltransferase family protein [Planctomycetota bacterium]|jgi:S-methylmethionine-dependent homocysteine/selenocysteine methylase